MASLTIRKLDDALKKRLRLRAAQNGRSMEDEARTILRRAAAGEDVRAEAQAGKRRASRRSTTEQPAPAPDDAGGPGAKRVLLIIGGGIAAYKSLDLIRRLKERGAAVRCILTAAAQQFVTPLAAGALAGETRVHRSVRCRERVRRRPYPARARDRSRDRGAGDRRPDGQDGGRPCRRSRLARCCWRPTGRC